MNVYDFDGTIYDGDSTIDFYFYCLKKYPRIVFCLPRQLMAALWYKMKRCDKTRFKESFYSFLKKIPEMDREIVSFWDKHECKIKECYRSRQKPDDVIISASPEFFLAEICSRIGIRYLIASKVDKRTGKYSGTNCYGEEKSRQFYCNFPEGIIDEFYSDSYSDEPMAKLARKSFIVSKNKIEKWERK